MIQLSYNIDKWVPYKSIMIHEENAAEEAN